VPARALFPVATLVPFREAPVVALAFDFASMVATRGQGRAFLSGARCTIAVTATPVVFFAWTYPANVRTEN
jgi:hypothetical protein